jgi:hypothetical protein
MASMKQAESLGEITAQLSPMLLKHALEGSFDNGSEGFSPDGEVTSSTVSLSGVGVSVNKGVEVRVGVGGQDDELLVGTEVVSGLNGGAISTQGVALGLACAPTRESAVDRAERISN